MKNTISPNYPLYLLRFIAAIMIVLHHSTAYFFSCNLSMKYNYNLDVAVDFFFILSGFMMYHIYPSVDNKSEFVIKRLCKLYPTYILTALIAWIMFDYNTGWQNVLANLLLIQTFFMKPAYYFSLNDVSWCVSVELFFYICYALYCKNIFKAFYGFMVINLSLYLIAFNSDLPFYANFSSNQIDIIGIIQTFPLTRAVQFFFGCIIAYLYKKNKPMTDKKSNIKVIFGFLLILCAGKNIFLLSDSEAINRFFYQYYKCILIGGGIFLCTYKENIIQQKTALFLGQISYAVFMTHQLLVHAFKKYNLLISYSSSVRYTAYLISTLLIAVLTYKMIEEPLYKYGKKKIKDINEIIKKASLFFKNNLGIFIIGVITTFAFNCVYLKTNNNYKYVNINFNINADASNAQPYVKIYYTPDKNTAFAEKYTLMIPLLNNQKKVEATINTNQLYMLRLSMVNMKNAEISDLYVNGTDIKTVDYNNVYTADCSYIPQTNGFTYHSDKVHGYIVFKTALEIDGEKNFREKINPITTVILGMFISIIFLILTYFTKKILSTKPDRKNKYEYL